MTLGFAGLAAWYALARRARLRPGQEGRVLGAGGAIGPFAVQIATILGATSVVAAARNPAAKSAADRVVGPGSPELTTLVLREP
ncbi:hypothetical protein GCM10009789_01720 [Kribbella sancticallisti]|uniref:Zinc-binding dehydrogenase n=1 Tax=Kribbella sancticallisti TaxID=460087 RepID=A0ABN2C2Q9_9ACTN